MGKSKFNYKIYNSKTIKNYFKNSKILFLTFIFSAGIIIGAININTETMITEKLTELVSNYLINKPEQGIKEIFISSILSNTVFLTVNLFLSFSLIGYSLIPWIPLLKGMGLGAVCGFIYSTYKISGFGYCLLTVFPGAIVSVFALISACNSGFDYSKNACQKSIFGSGQFEKGETKFFLIRQIIYITICIASSMIDALFSFIFLRIFEL